MECVTIEDLAQTIEAVRLSKAPKAMNANLCPFGGALEHIESSSWVTKLVRGYFFVVAAAS